MWNIAMEYYSAIKRKEILTHVPTCTSQPLRQVETSPTQNNKHCRRFHMYEISKIGKFIQTERAVSFSFLRFTCFQDFLQKISSCLARSKFWPVWLELHRRLGRSQKQGSQKHTTQKHFQPLKYNFSSDFYLLSVIFCCF